MVKKITRTELTEIIDRALDETTESFAQDLEKTVGPNRPINFQEFADTILPKLVSDALINSRRYATYIVDDVLERLDLIIEDETVDED